MNVSKQEQQTNLHIIKLETIHMDTVNDNQTTNRQKPIVFFYLLRLRYLPLLNYTDQSLVSLQ